MASMIQLKGMDKVLSNLKTAGKRIESGIGRGLVKGGRFLQSESQKVCPVLTGNLRGSAFTRRLGDKHVIVGYTAEYAAYVHEDLDKAHGRAFNIKHAEKIAQRAERAARRRRGKRPSNVIVDPYFIRGENQQAKFLEQPAKEKRDKILQIVADEARRI